MDREKLEQEVKDWASYVAVEMPDKEKKNIQIFRHGNTDLQLVSICTFLNRFAEKNGQKGTDLIPYFTNILLNNSKEGK